MERTLVLIKPEAVERGLIGKIMSRYEKKEYELIGILVMRVSKDLAEQHYQEHKDKPYFEDLIKRLRRGPVCAMVWRGYDVISGIRKMNGSAKPNKAKPGTIRFDFASTMEWNMVHASDSLQSAEREIALWFDSKN